MMMWSLHFALLVALVVARPTQAWHPHRSGPLYRRVPHISGARTAATTPCSVGPTIGPTVERNLVLFANKDDRNVEPSNEPSLAWDPPAISRFGSSTATAIAVSIATVALVSPETATAATSAVPAVVYNTFVAYGHYLCLLVMTALLTYERVTVRAAMDVDTEKSVVVADALYGLVAVALFATGYLRVTDLSGKGWDFYAHEPFFWLKLASAGLLGGLSLFPTITFIRRGQVLFSDDANRATAWEPLSPALVNRLHKVMNAELTAVATLPLMATLMARGVGYAEWLPWQAGAALVATTLVGSSVLYAKQALTWTEPTEDDGP